ncbi:Phosphatidylinositol-4-phosphate 5-kinase [Apophysomyces ossiformis]|uniref:1-phosphatidylinositol-4-phosphate 5-kinase n=1 Tax=Apophysomyces ossiformis TaxID=679940 RepID=A0A8H7BIV7_9FUNG|nr:Phosphatidylinositol-4-phosphate 5-kinase [Apophysomyces ossiformis]
MSLSSSQVIFPTAGNLTTPPPTRPSSTDPPEHDSYEPRWRESSKLLTTMLGNEKLAHHPSNLMDNPLKYDDNQRHPLETMQDQSPSTTNDRPDTDTNIAINDIATKWDSNHAKEEDVLDDLYPNVMTPSLKKQLTKQSVASSTETRETSTLSSTWSRHRHAGPQPPSSITSHRQPITAPDLGELDEDEQAALEIEIAARRAARRASRRRMRSTSGHDEDDDRVVIGTRVGEGHRSYQLMYDMLTGIRIAVGRVSAKNKRELTDADFTAAHKLVFDITGNELTPGVKYDFKFKDYAPWVFRSLREEFHIDAADYMMSLTNKYILSELTSPGKSGSFFYYSRDYRFIIKTIHHSEHKFMRKILKEYYQHVCDNPNTLLCRFYGLHRIKLPRGRKIHFVVMGNIVPGSKDIHQTYDLKGSTFGRMTPDEDVARNPHAVMKDQNWVKRCMRLELGPLKSNMLLDQLKIDVELLERLNIMDYSLLVGIHDIRRGNTEGIRDTHLHMVQPHTKELQRQLSSHHGRRKSKAEIFRQAIKYANTIQLDSSELPESPLEERRYCVFYAEEGGFRSTDESNSETDKLYFLGVIDILTPYNLKKKAEHFWKSLTQDKYGISAVQPQQYGNRFLRFVKNAVMVA